MRCAAILLALSAAGAASRPPAVRPVFACALGAKQVSVSAVGDQLIYRFGARNRSELTIAGSAAGRNLFRRTARFAAMEHQLRFTNGRYSYVVFSLAANPAAGARGVSGLTVFDGSRVVSERTCSRWTALDLSVIDRLPLPEDGEDWSAI